MTIAQKQFLETSCGRIAYLEAGAPGGGDGDGSAASPEKPVVLFVHGIPTSGLLWRHVLRFLQRDFHCIAPDLLGLGETVPREGWDAYHMDAQAEMLLELMTKLGHAHFSIVAHDQGGAAAQIIAARQPDRVSTLVLTNCVCFDNWPVPVIRRLQRLASVRALWELAVRSGVSGWLERTTRLSAFRRGVHDPAKLTNEAIAAYLEPLGRDRAARERFRRFVLAGHSRYTELAVADLRRFDKPTLVLWAADDAFLSPSWGAKLVEEIPGARPLVLMPFCGHFWPEERPAEGASHIERFLRDALSISVKETITVVASEPAALPPAKGAPPCAQVGKRRKLPVADKEAP